MPRPRLKESFLKQAFMLSKKNTRIYYYDFCKADEVDSIVEKIKIEAKKYKKKIKILKTIFLIFIISEFDMLQCLSYPFIF